MLKTAQFRATPDHPPPKGWGRFDPSPRAMTLVEQVGPEQVGPGASGRGGATVHLRFPSASAIPARLRAVAPVALVAATVMTLATGAGAATVRHTAAAPTTHKSLAASKHLNTLALPAAPA